MQLYDGAGVNDRKKNSKFFFHYLKKTKTAELKNIYIHIFPKTAEFFLNFLFSIVFQKFYVGEKNFAYPKYKVEKYEHKLCTGRPAPNRHFVLRLVPAK